MFPYALCAYGTQASERPIAERRYAVEDSRAVHDASAKDEG